jgi:DNA-binding MarR family transcriptional regulator
MNRHALHERFRVCLQALLDEALAHLSQGETREILSSQEGILVEIVGRRRSVSMSELARAAGTRPNTMTGVVDRLVRRGVLERRHAEADRRIIQVNLTALGREYLAAYHNLIRHFAGSLLARLDAADRLRLVTLLERVVAGADA